MPQRQVVPLPVGVSTLLDDGFMSLCVCAFCLEVLSNRHTEERRKRGRERNQGRQRWQPCRVRSVHHQRPAFFFWASPRHESRRCRYIVAVVVAGVDAGVIYSLCVRLPLSLSRFTTVYFSHCD